MSPSDLRRSLVTVNLGVLIGAGFGLVFLMANSGTPLPATVGVAIKGAGGAAVAAAYGPRRGSVGSADES